ncbi:GLE1-domain-containing protein [Anaeromyces robustus]|uniref:mRNA export factor GLE1 n=1 Tax=Anaeromyces robustus TaxID=1754192 RepID=A0A1Y1XDJ8_9FUNG|nr:GLE1-domain-containing protein [Anaeromyces robustus]|eukprot:ORX83772.1 GLE1-domain-containing protein [Anaeromyces robustus]
MGTIGLFNDDSSDSEVEVQKVNEKHVNERKVIKTIKHKNINKRRDFLLKSKHMKNKSFSNYTFTPVNPIIKEIRKSQCTNNWKKLSNNIEKESWLVANFKIKEFENHNFNIKSSFSEDFKKEIEKTQNNLSQLSLWGKSIREKETLKMNKNNDLMNKEIEDCIKYKKQQEALIEKKKKEELERKLKEEKAKKELELQKQKKLEQEKLEKEKAQKLKKEQEEKIKQQQELVKKQEEQKKAMANDTLSSFGSQKAIDEAHCYIDEIKKIKNEIRPAVKENKEWKKQSFMLKMKITTRVGQITNTRDSVKEISNALNDVLNQGKQISNEVYYWLMDFLGKAMMKQAEKEISINKTMAFPLAHIFNIIVSNHEPFFKIFMGRLYKKCIYLIPRYGYKTKDKSDEECLKEIGYKKTSEGMENESRYNERMEGMITLFSAIIQTPNTSGNSKLNMASGWTWLARILNMPPRQITSLTLITFLEIAGNEMLNVYGKQMHKLLNFIMKVYIPMAPKESIAATTRLKLFIEKYQKDGGRIDIPKGKNFT